MADYADTIIANWTSGRIAKLRDRIKDDEVEQLAIDFMDLVDRYKHMVQDRDFNKKLLEEKIDELARTKRPL